VVDADRGGRSRCAVLQRHTKYVVSATLTTATRRNSKIVGRYDPDAIRSLKDEVDGDLYVSGSGTLVRAMLADGPGRRARSVRLSAHPRVRSAAVPGGAAPGKLSLAACDSYKNGVVYLAYRPQA
jgi:dihydrofolate reductase